MNYLETLINSKLSRFLEFHFCNSNRFLYHSMKSDRLAFHLKHLPLCGELKEGNSAIFMNKNKIY